MAVALILAETSFAVHAQTAVQTSGFLTPFPENDTYQIVLLGDSLAEPLMDTLPEVLAEHGKDVVRKPLRQLNGLIRPEAMDELKKLEETLKGERSHIAIVFVGADERQALRLPSGRRSQVGSTQWREEYGRRVDALMKMLRRLNLATYWVGQPVMRRSDWNDDVQVMNEIVREKALLNQVKYIDIFQAFADDSGGYDARGPDITGKERVLRDGDGVHFTMAGARKLAHFVEREVQRDIASAKQERVVPLAGDEQEQKRLAATRAQAASPAWQGTVTTPNAQGTAGRSGTPAGGAAAAAGAAAAGAGRDQKADSSRVALKIAGAGNREETVAIDIVRPAIPAAVVELVTRRESADKPSIIGEVVADDIGGGAVVLSSVTLATEGAAQGRRTERQIQVGAPYFRVMVKGERLTPKPGRSDDLRWPPAHERAEAAPAPLPPKLEPGGQPPAGKGKPRS